MIGNRALLDARIIGFLASSKISTPSVIPTLDWAADTSHDAAAVVAGGFQSKLEKQVFDFLTRGDCGIIYVLNRGMYKQVPERLKRLIDEGRLLIISVAGDDSKIPSRRNARVRNQYIAHISTEMVLASLHPESSLNELLSIGKPIKLM